MSASNARALTLLEAVLALAILSAALVVALQVRAGALAQTLDLERRLRMNRDVEAIIALKESGALGFAQVDERSGVRRWSGELHANPFAIRATPTLVPNPVASPDHPERAQQVPMLRYEVTYLDETVVFMSDR